ncbi:MAG: site-specific integrase [Candidatus Brocadiaceae bacterium]|nr:site-specific integrase [Candidatus Brocadiaceae bacterium]
MAKGIYKRGNIYWIRYTDLNGKKAFESSRSTKFRVAEKMLLKRKQAISEGKQPDVKRIRNHIFRELVSEYIEWAKRQKSFNSKIYLINQLAEKFGNIPLRRFNTMLLEQYQTKRLNSGNKASTVNRLQSTIAHMFTKAVEWDMVEEDTLKRIRKVKLLPENNRRLRFLTHEECQSLIASCNHHLKPIVITALNTGMRKEEILSLKWDNVNLKCGFILLAQEQTKNGERKEVPINSTLRKTFQELPRRLNIPYVFFDQATGKRFKDVKKSFHSALSKAGICDFRFHDLRHTFASHLVMAGIDITTVKELLGHKDIKMTLRYAHLAPGHKVKAVDTLDNILTKTQSIQKVYNFKEAKNGL